jgi:hypothetical protein
MKMYVPVPLGSGPGQVVSQRDVQSISRIGIVDDNLDPSLMEGVVERLKELVPGADVTTWLKPSGTAPAPDEMIDEMASQVDIAIAAIAMCGSCTAGVVLDATRLYKRGVPTVAISWEIFERAARSMATLQGVPELSLAIIQKLEVGQGPSDQHAKGRACADVILERLVPGTA